MKKEEGWAKYNFLDKSPFYQIKLFGGIGVTIVCMALAIIAYEKLKAISGDVYDITDNWKSKPVSAVYIPQSPTESCPSDYSQITLEKSDFTGIRKGPCGCVPNDLGYVSAAANCSDAAEPTNFCMSAPYQGELASKTWRGTKICFKRGGEASTSWEDGYYRRPYPDTNGSCPTSYKRCGRGTTYADGAICFPEAEVCPITGMVVAPLSNPPPSEDAWSLNATFPDGTYGLYVRREFEGEFPVIDLELHLNRYGSTDYQAGNYDSDNNARGPCYLGSRQVFSEYPFQISQQYLWSIYPTYPSTCSREDARFVLFDRVGLESHFLENLELGLPVCAGFKLYARSDPLYQASQDPDYLNSGVRCGGSMRVCSRDANQATNCADSICDQVVHQSVCGQYVQAARSVAGDSNTFGMFRRGEIEWKEDCLVSPDQVYSNIDPLTAALAAQLAGLVMSCVFGGLFGAMMPLVGVTFSLMGGQGCRQNKEIEARLLQVDPYLHLFKLAPIIAAIVFIGQIHHMYAAASEGECSDPTTNATFRYLGEALPSIYQTSLANVLLESGLFLLACYYRYAQRKSAAASVVPSTAVAEVDTGEPAPLRESAKLDGSVEMVPPVKQQGTGQPPSGAWGAPPQEPPMDRPPQWGAPPPLQDPRSAPPQWGAPPHLSAVAYPVATARPYGAVPESPV